MLRALKGAPLSCLVALLTSEGAVTRAWLCRATGYCKRTVSEALETLADWGLATAAPEGDGWLLTEAVSQLGLLPETQKTAKEGDQPAAAATEAGREESLEEGKNFFHQLVEVVKLINLNILTTTDSQGAQGENFSHPQVGAGKRPKPDPLDATHTIFGEAVVRLRPPPSPRLILAWIAQAYRQRHKLRKPARVVYANLLKGLPPDEKYYRDPCRYLPADYLRAAGLPLPEEPPTALPPEPLPKPEADPRPAPHPSVQEPLAGNTALSPARAMQQALDGLRAEAGRAVDKRYLEPARLARYDPETRTFTLTLPTAQQRDWLANRAATQLEKTLLGICNQRVRVEFCIDAEAAGRATQTAGPAADAAADAVPTNDT